MTVDDALCEGVRTLLDTASRMLPVKGVGVVRADDRELTLTYVDPFGATAYRMQISEAPAPFKPRSSGQLHTTAQQLEANPTGLVESRLLHPTFSDEIRREAAVADVLTLPVPGIDSTLLVVGFAEHPPLGPAQIAGIDSLAADVVGIVNRTESQDEELAVLRRLHEVDRLLPAFLRVLDVREIFDQVSAITKNMLRHDFASLAIYSEDATEIEVYAQTASEPFKTHRGRMPFPPAQTKGWRYRIIDDLSTHPLERNWESMQAGGRSSIRVAIRQDDTLLGALNFTSSERAPYTAADLRVANRIADYAALALSHQRLAEESRRASTLQERAANLEMLDGLLNTLTGVLDIRSVFDRVATIGSTVLPHDAMTIVVRSERPGRVRLHAATGALSQMEVPMEVPIPNPALLEGPWDFELIDDISEDPLYAASPSAKAGMRSLLTMPIRLGGELLGGVNLLSATPGRFTRDDVPLARRITDHIALAMSHHRLAEEVRHSEELRSRTANLELLDALLATVTDGGELRDVIDRISDIAQKVLPHDAMVLPVLLPDRAHVRFHVTKAPDGAKFPEVVEVPEHLRTSDWEYDLVDDLQADPANRDFNAAKLGYRSALRVPIRVEGQLAAGVGFFSFAPASYKQADVSIAHRVADRLAISLLRERGLEAAKRADEAAERASRLESRVQALTEELNARAGFHRVIGKSPSWRQVLTQATQVAATETTVLLLGESGTGKEVVARFLHRASVRKNGPFVALNCAALPEQLLESELFGYERGAFTGAMVSRAGKLEQAAGGVLFLDEVGEMTTPVQAKFLRVLQEREFQRLGGSKTLKTDARVIAATNRDPKQAMERGTFREDLYYRLSVFEIALPPLRDRKDDILLLVDAFLKEMATSVGRPAAGLSEDAKDRLLTYGWPGNVRELRNAIERAVILCEGGLIASGHLPIAVGQARQPSAHVISVDTKAASPPEGMKLEAVERDLLHKALAKAGNNKSQAAKILGVPRGQFYSLLKRHGLTDAKR